LIRRSLSSGVPDRESGFRLPTLTPSCACQNPRQVRAPPPFWDRRQRHPAGREVQPRQPVRISKRRFARCRSATTRSPAASSRPKQSTRRCRLEDSKDSDSYGVVQMRAVATSGPRSARRDVPRSHSRPHGSGVEVINEAEERRCSGAAAAAGSPRFAGLTLRRSRRRCFDLALRRGRQRSGVRSARFGCASSQPGPPGVG
jgi:hypothetical protein